MGNIRLLLQYDGTRFHGWQRQKGARTVQQCVEEAIERTTGAHSAVHGSGRTDAGVHAEGQVANFHTRSGLAPGAILRALNAHLPRDVAVLKAEEADQAFHARLSARRKLYRYTIYNDPVRPVLDRQFVYHVPGRLNAPAMRRAARSIVGEHDFRAFASEASRVKDAVRTVYSCRLKQSGRRIILTVEGNGFLYNMVRAIVGSLLEVGRGRRRPEWIAELLQTRKRSAGGPTAPARGLCLVRVDY